MELAIPAGAVLSALLAINLWFIRRLVIKIDTMSLQMPVQQNEMKNMSDKIFTLEREIRNLSHELKDFGHMRERLAVLEAICDQRIKKRKIRVNSDS